MGGKDDTLTDDSFGADVLKADRGDRFLGESGAIPLLQIVAPFWMKSLTERRYQTKRAVAN